MESYASRSKQIHEDASLKLKSQTFAKFYAEIISAVTVIWKELYVLNSCG